MLTMQVFLLITSKEILQVSPVYYGVVLTNMVLTAYIVNILSIAGYSGSLTSAGSLGAASEQQALHKEADPSCIDAATAAAESGNLKDVAKSEGVDLGMGYEFDLTLFQIVFIFISVF
jgi:uncharacterized transporter YbjL